jgi:Reverse transcriptase (RNA-dependent DNA polymerase)
MLALYVEDIVLFARDTQAIRWIKDILTSSFKIKDLGPIPIVLGMRIQRDRARRMI